MRVLFLFIRNSRPKQFFRTEFDVFIRWRPIVVPQITERISFLMSQYIINPMKRSCLYFFCISNSSYVSKNFLFQFIQANYYQSEDSNGCVWSEQKIILCRFSHPVIFHQFKNIEWFWDIFDAWTKKCKQNTEFL